jgi:hypothetical protein
MHNWFEIYGYARERTSELMHLSQSIRIAQDVRGWAQLRMNAAGIAREQAPKQAPVPESVTSGRDPSGARATFVMERGEVLSIRVGNRPYRIAVVAGKLWATMDGSTVDTVLASGESLAYRGKGKVVVQALRTATVRVEYPAAARVFVSSPLRQAFQLG